MKHRVVHIQTYPIPQVKRFFDVGFSFLVLLILSPFIVVILLLIALENGLRGKPFAPLFYTEDRMSHGKKFRLIKFNIFKQAKIDIMRSNHQFIHTKDLEKNGSLKYIGWILKQIYFDELPQLFNVLKGDMSLVGPRPLNLEVYRKLEKTMTPTQALITAGMTGNFQSMKNTDHANARVLDQEYLNRYIHGSASELIVLDIKILLRTLRVIARAKGV